MTGRCGGCWRRTAWWRTCAATCTACSASGSTCCTWASAQVRCVSTATALRSGSRRRGPHALANNGNSTVRPCSICSGLLHTEAQPAQNTETRHTLRWTGNTTRIWDGSNPGTLLSPCCRPPG